MVPWTLPRVCVLTGTHRGDNAQVLNLAQALDWPFEVKGEVDPVMMMVIDRIANAAGIHLRRNKPLLSSLLWPDLILMIGGSRLLDAFRIQSMSEGRSRIVALGRPVANLDRFDLVITTPQYRLPDHPNVMKIDMPLNDPSPDALGDAAAAWQGEINHLPKPWIAVLVGGNSGSCIFDKASGQRLAADANRLAAETGGSLLISTSGRTPDDATDALLAGIEAPHFAFRWSKEARRNPHLGFLALADRFIVTSDSASMVAEAVSTTRPVSVFELPLRRHSRWMTRPSSRARTHEGLRRRMAASGAWMPARDMQGFHQNLRAQGYIQGLDGADQGRPPKRSHDLDRAVQAIRRLFPDVPAPLPKETSSQPERRPVHGLAIAG